MNLLTNLFFRNELKFSLFIAGKQKSTQNKQKNLCTIPVTWLMTKYVMAVYKEAVLPSGAPLGQLLQCSAVASGRGSTGPHLLHSQHKLNFDPPFFFFFLNFKSSQWKAINTISKWRGLFWCCYQPLWELSVLTLIHTTNQAVISSYLYLDQTHKSDNNNHSNMVKEHLLAPTNLSFLRGEPVERQTHLSQSGQDGRDKAIHQGAWWHWATRVGSTRTGRITWRRGSLWVATFHCKPFLA